jgi:hypothetical protein
MFGCSSPPYSTSTAGPQQDAVEPLSRPNIGNAVCGRFDEATGCHKKLKVALQRRNWCPPLQHPACGIADVNVVVGVS